ncbi:MAG TPA: nucleotidyl transferase AbiEii/AbiGii toxin family protein [Capsulimonadaceae bacterium]|jgi:predicted nucleotidyltransferase component of viral defense system
MHDAIKGLLDRYSLQTRDDYYKALREILQQVALLGLWRASFFDHAAFYGGTSLRLLYGLDRFSEGMGFSLLAPNPTFSLEPFGDALEREIASFGFDVTFERRSKSHATAIASAFLKASTVQEMIKISARPELVRDLHPNTSLKIKIEIDTDPPGRFETETKYLLAPIPFPVRVYTLPNLLAGKLHAILCRQWASRVKGRDWYDLVWYAGRYPIVNLAHLEERMRQSGHWNKCVPLDMDALSQLLRAAVNRLDVDHARTEVAPFVHSRETLAVWSRPFFMDVIGRIRSLDTSEDFPNSR